MGSRRRSPSNVPYDVEFSQSSSSDADNVLELLPTVKKTKSNTKHDINDYLGHHKWNFSRRPVVHPLLTDFGPETLQKFLQNELDRLNALVGRVHNQQEQALRDLAKVLVRAQSNLKITREGGQNRFQLSNGQLLGIEDAEPLSLPNQTTDKGKTPIRKRNKAALNIPQSSTSSPSQNQGTSYSDQSLIYRRARRSTLPPHRSDRAGSYNLFRDMFKAVASPYTRNTREVSTSRPSLTPQATESHTETLPALGRSPSQIEGRSQYSARPIQEGRTPDGSNSQTSTATVMQSKPEDLLETSEVRLSRTSSFENHASFSRDSLRPNNRIANLTNHSPDDSRRRRKTPAILQWSPLPSAWMQTFDGQSSAQPQNDDSVATASSSTTFLDDSIVKVEPKTVQSRTDELSVTKSTDQLPDPSRTNPLHSLVDLQVGHNEDIDMTDARREAEIGEQKAILESVQEAKQLSKASSSGRSSLDPVRYEYYRMLPEDIPSNIRQAEINRCSIWAAHGLDARGHSSRPKRPSHRIGPFSETELDPRQKNFLSAPDGDGDYPRRYEPHRNRNSGPEPPYASAMEVRTTLPVEIWDAETGKTPGGVLQYLSSSEVRNLRLVCKSLAEDLEPYVFRNVVTNFGPSLFSLQPSYDEHGRIEIDSTHSMLDRHGAEINKFGISFEYDAPGLMHAPFKITEKVVDAWFGRYVWPVKDYPYFSPLSEIDKLLDDDRRLLTQSMRKLTKCRELAISVDSGLGWLEGPDVSDLALYRSKVQGGSKVFGKTCTAPDLAYEDGMQELFKWAQTNTINENIKYLDCRWKKAREELDRLRSIVVRDYDSYRDAGSQPDYTQHLHTGGIVEQRAPLTPRHLRQVNTAAFFAAQPRLQNHLQTTQPLVPNQNPILNTAQHAVQTSTNLARRQRFQDIMDLVGNNTSLATPPSTKKLTKRREVIQPQWPIIFNGFNLAAESKGDSNFVQRRIARPSDFPILPNWFTEAQAQWTMETSWIQRTFLSAYTDAVQVNSSAFKNVHSLHIAKISSGLLPMLSQKTFWSCLRGLRKVTILVKPDWRSEHIPGDKFFQSNMAIEPVDAAYKFAQLLRDCIAPLENLNSLCIGYLGSGEHQTGIFGRNQHILPAPITSTPREWLTAQNPSMPKPSMDTIFVFPHVRTLTFENCWFSPLMLENFMIKSRDTSLHNLVLDSVSLTAQITSSRTDGPLRTIDNQLKCQHSPSAWLNEKIPANAAWVNVLDKVSPGKTILDHKHDAGMVDEEQNPRPEPTFKGNIQQITLKSCGYVKILGIASNDFNQNELVFQNSSWTAMDEGLKARACTFTKVATSGRPSEAEGHVPGRNAQTTQPGQRHRTSLTHNINAAAGNNVAPPQRQQRNEAPTSSSRFIMLSGRSGHTRGDSVFANDDNTQSARMTGYLTQCIHPVEKRILERMWGMTFGWGDDMSRWEAVEDGWFMGGTGRFSGEIYKDADLQDAAALPISYEENERNDVLTANDDVANPDSDTDDDNETATGADKDASNGCDNSVLDNDAESDITDADDSTFLTQGSWFADPRQGSFAALYNNNLWPTLGEDDDDDDDTDEKVV
ncbi:hypothetical protein LTR05_001442 [Lithohypha guttulata]|uniref:F-box domain-containing protein n=1 Tax=Lithohypha guttulata TaxID=1690604 RepID=A0AAN7YLE8_9EURO|nr:hypothetical protein LTR05_001442 [Lithohypha guttulata]